MLGAIFLISCAAIGQITQQVALNGRAFQGKIGGSEAIPIEFDPLMIDGCAEEQSTTARPTPRNWFLPVYNDDGLLTGSRQFALDLFKTVLGQSETGNVFLSPTSIWLALTSTYMGAKGETADQLAKLLGLSTRDKQQLSAEIIRLRSKYEQQSAAGAGNTLRLANRFYFERGLALCPRITGYLGGESAVQQLDFAASPEESRTSINGWVESVTDRKIRDLLAPGDVDRFSRLVLANAAYFKGQWAVSFDEKRTRNQKFYLQPQLADSATVNVAMMVVRDEFHYVKSGELGARIVELPFVGRDLSLFVALPTLDQDPIEDVVGRLTPAAIRDALSVMRPRTISLSMPRLNVEQSFELADVLSTLGVGSLFDRSRSDLSGFAGNRDLFVSKIRHKAIVELNEKGAVAAAATAIVIQTYSAIQDDVVTLNRPFLFFIRDNRLDSILFVGLIRQPQPATV